MWLMKSTYPNATLGPHMEVWGRNALGFEGPWAVWSVWVITKDTKTSQTIWHLTRGARGAGLVALQRKTLSQRSFLRATG